MLRYKSEVERWEKKRHHNVWKPIMQKIKKKTWMSLNRQTQKQGKLADLIRDSSETAISRQAHTQKKTNRTGSSSKLPQNKKDQYKKKGLRLGEWVPHYNAPLEIWERRRERESTRGSVKQDCGIHQTHTRLTTRVSAATSHVTAALSLSSYERNFNTATHTNAHREKKKQTNHHQQQ